MKLKTLGILGSALLVSSVAFAGNGSSNANPGFYMGLQAGYANMGYDKAWLRDQLKPEMTLNDAKVDASGFAGRLFAGYDFTQMISAEMGYTYLPKINLKDQNTDKGSFNNGDLKTYLIDLFAKGKFSVGSGVDLYGKVGGAYMAMDSFSYTNNSGSVTYKKVDNGSKVLPALGAGATYNFDQNISADLGYTRYFGVSDFQSIDFFFAGINYKF